MEDVQEMVDAGMRWLAVNLGDGHSWEDWATVVSRARAQGAAPVPWARCRTLLDCYRLLDAADQVGFQAILNIEDEFETTCSPTKVAGVIKQFPDLSVGISSVAWLYNAVDFTPLAQQPMLLQVFPADNGWSPEQLEQRQADCVAHAREKGFKHIGVTFQTYGGARPEWYAYHKGIRSYYTGDDIGAGNWEAWS